MILKYYYSIKGNISDELGKLIWLQTEWVGNDVGEQLFRWVWLECICSVEVEGSNSKYNV